MFVADSRVTVDEVTAVDLVTSILTSAGATPSGAETVARHLVESDRVGIESHGLSRVAQYVTEIANGALEPAAEPTIERVSPTRVLVDGGGGFGQVACARAVTLVAHDVDRFGTGVASVRNVGHTGRLGAYTEPLAAGGHIAIAFGTGRRRHHWVPPFGGRRGRMSTNPIAWSAPTSGPLVSADLATTAVPEGRIRIWRQVGMRTPPDVLCTAEGEMTTDPAALYTDPPGFLLPLGGVHHGHKGYALALLGEVLSTLWAGDDTDADEGRGNNLCLIALRGEADLPARVERMADYMRSSPPIDPDRPVLVPGEREQKIAAQRDGIEIESVTFDTLVKLAKERNIPIPDVDRTTSP